MVSRLPVEAESAPRGEVLVRFQGEGSGSDELTWGQYGLWQVMAEKDTWLPIGAVQPLPGGTTLDDAVADLRFVMSRYPSMRTRLRLDAERPRQVVSTSGVVRLEVVDAADADDPAEVAAQVDKRYRAAEHDFTRDWPVRMAVIRHRGCLTHRVWIMCHLVTDGGGANVILSELADRDAPRDRSPMPPLAQVQWQRSPAGQRQCRAALRYLERLLRRIPARRFPERGGTPYPRYWQARFESLALHLAIQAIAARTGVETSSVLLAAYAVAMARVTGANPVVAQVLVSNRFRPGLAETVSPVMQNGLCAIVVPDATVDEAVAATRRQALNAYKYAYYDPRQRDALLARVAAERGEPIDIESYFNDRRLLVRDQSGPAPTSGRVRAALPRTTFEWRYKQDYQPFDSLYVNVDDVPDLVAMTVLADIHHVSPVDVEAAVRGMEEVAVAAALDPTARTAVPAAVAG